MTEYNSFSFPADFAELNLDLVVDDITFGAGGEKVGALTDDNAFTPELDFG